MLTKINMKHQQKYSQQWRSKPVGPYRCAISTCYLLPPAKTKNCCQILLPFFISQMQLQEVFGTRGNPSHYAVTSAVAFLQFIVGIPPPAQCSLLALTAPLTYTNVIYQQQIQIVDCKVIRQGH